MSKVLLSKMFVGTYNENSIGHEVINFYLPDNCKDSFLYNPAYGKGQNVDVVVLIGAPQKYAYPVLAVALNVQKIAIQENENLANKICYGNKLLKDIDLSLYDFLFIPGGKASFNNLSVITFIPS